MNGQPVLVVGGGIGGLSTAIALRRPGHAATVIEKKRVWSFNGVGIIQQANVARYFSSQAAFGKLEIRPFDANLCLIRAPGGDSAALEVTRCRG